MVFTELLFFYFLAGVLGVYWLLPSWRLRKLYLLLASYFFYGFWDYRFLSLILISTVLDYLIGLLLVHQKSLVSRRSLLVASLTVNLGILGVFKYFNFFIDSAAQFITLIGFEANLPVLEVILPVGISFYTFQTLSYSIDIYRNKLEPTRDFMDFALFVAFFPQLVAGPIVRASDFIPQLRQPVKAADINFQRWATLFLIGFIKKACVADNVAPQVDLFFAAPQEFTRFAAMLATSLYAVQIYCDFSGYTDMAIATAGMLGFTLTKNFDHPYFARNITDFWRRWHISLSSWLRDYLYIPLGGNKKGPKRTYINLMLTMLLGGLWHGAAWTFIVWGFIHGVALALHKYISSLFPRTSEHEAPSDNWSKKAIQVIGTLAVVFSAWIFFRSTTIHDSVQTLGMITGFKPMGDQTLPQVYAWFLILLVIAHYFFYKIDVVQLSTRINSIVYSILFGFFAAVAISLMSIQYTPFIYFQF